MMLIKQNKVYAKQGVSKLIGIHEEAADWVVRVRNNGGSVSPKTIRAVSKFCIDINTAGLRDRFYRLNLFCGTGLNACLVPLYRGQSRTGTQYGNTTDTNTGPFVSGDYSETNGLAQANNNSGKYLRTGLSPDTIGVATVHGAYYSPTITTAFQFPMGSQNGTSDFFSRIISTTTQLKSGAGGTTTVDGLHSPGLILFQRESATALRLYTQGSLVATQTASTTPAANSLEFYIFTTNNNGSPSGSAHYNSPMRMYSLGTAMSEADVAAYSTAVEAFQAALGRSA
jgi:hypothetical protein